METFAKEPKLAKLLRELKPTLVSYNKIVHWFFSYVCNGKFAVFWVFFCGITCKWVLFPSIDIYFYQLAQIVGRYIIDSFSRVQSKLRQKLNVYVFQLAKSCTFVRPFCFSLSFLCACAAINPVNLVFKTTIAEDTHLTLAAGPFKVEANNSINFLPLKPYEKNFFKFPFLFRL